MFSLLAIKNKMITKEAFVEKVKVLEDLQQDIMDIHALLKYGNDSLTDEIIRKQSNAIISNLKNNLEEYLSLN